MDVYSSIILRIIIQQHPSSIDTAHPFLVIMSTAAPANSTAPKESKSAQKKKAKAEALAKAQAQAQAPAHESETLQESNRVESPTDGPESSSESPYVKELYKYDP